MNQTEAPVTCPNCGASFHDVEPRCPYCNSVNPRGAEAAYMEQLKELKDDTDELDDAARNDLSANLRNNSKRVVRVVVIVVAVISMRVYVNDIRERADVIAMTYLGLTKDDVDSIPDMSTRKLAKLIEEGISS